VVAFLSIVIFILLATNIVMYILYKEEQRRADYLEERRRSRLYGKSNKNFRASLTLALFFGIINII
jgi:hypothetical protein